jgi:hypothetical protein
MENIIYYSLCISVIFFIFKFIELKFQEEKDNNDLKIIFKDTFIVFLASLIGGIACDYLIKYVNPSSLLELNTEPVIFTDTPEF